jgi:transcriptional regulator with XRE-family HTH domain
MLFKDLLSEARKQKNMLKNEVATYFGWSRLYYGRYENGQLLPTKDNIVKFSIFIGIPIDALQEIIDNERRNQKHS